MTYLLSAINAKYIHSNPAVYSLYYYTVDKHAKQGYEIPHITIIEHTINNQLEDILEDIYSAKPDFIGFSCYIWNIRYINELIVELHKLLPDTHIWVGGPEVSYDPIQYLTDMPMVKGVICGEGEETFHQLVMNYELKSADLSNIKGICFKSDLGIISTDIPNTIPMDEIPFIYRDMDDFTNRIIYYESSRGCPFSCSYCLSSIDKCVRFRSIELVEKELQFFIDQQIPQVKFIDRTFNCNPDRAFRIWKYIHEHDRGITNFHFEIAGDLLNEAQLELIKDFRPGLIQFEIGVQSTNPDTIQEIRRKCDFKKLKENVLQIESFKNIHQHLDLIAGLPYEDIHSFRDSFNQVYSLKPNQLQLGFLKVLSGSHMKDMVKDYHLSYRSLPPYQVLVNKWLSHYDLLRLKHIEQVVEIYYNSNQFANSIKYLEQFFDTAFDMYDKLGDYYYRTFDTGVKHSRIFRYNFLLDFFQKILGEEIEQINHFKQLLTLDVYLRENIKTRPDFAVNLDVYHKILTNIKKANSLPNQAHIEIFMDKGRERYVYFDYNSRDSLTNNATLKELEI
ncbi:MAG: B12-binding domain-containing radical SAM protein [Lachnospiraceae bacterium]|nr:B12-binding domain-containing radical SAM protein [Lachnospiraceae bacterium]